MHLATAATRPCARCGTFFCDACLDRSGLCGACSARQSPSALAVVSALVGAFSLCGFVWGVIAIALATIELGRIKRGTASARGADWARAGRTLGAVALLLGALVWLVLA
ncbi:MAG: hypothetical protein IAE78_05960 [Myxococcus sp.]|nr:hypothetical protein [Myxococcus sp.]